MKRQKIRKATILISLLLFPVTIFYLSPGLIIRGARLGVVNGSMITFALLFVSALFLGRSFCAWVCPAAGLGEACFTAQNRRAPGGRYNWIKYFIWVPWISTIVILAIRSGGFHDVDPLMNTFHGVSLHEPYSYITLYIVLAVIVTLSLVVGRRSFCHHVCWMAPFMVLGQKLRKLGCWPALHIESDPSKCDGCGVCTKQCPMSLDVQEMVQDDERQDSECILCGTCVDVCPNQVSRFAWLRRGSAASPQPDEVPALQPARGLRDGLA